MEHLKTKQTKLRGDNNHVKIKRLKSAMKPNQIQLLPSSLQFRFRSDDH